MLSVSLLTTTQIVLSLLLYAGVLLWALARISWVELVADSRRQHLLFGSVFVLFVLWLLRKEFDNGLTFHFLGLTAITLMLDWPLAVLGASVLLCILLPVLVPMAMSRLLERFRPPTLFLYIFIAGFFAAALAAVTTMLAGLGLLAWSGQLRAPDSLVELAGYMILVAF